MTAKRLAEARRLAADATAAHEAARSKAQSIRNRIAEAKARQTEITALRLAGTASEADTAEFAALGGDICGLQAMRIAADQAVVASHPEPANNRVRAAEAEHARAQNEIAFDLLAAQAEKLELALLGCLGDLYAIGSKIKGPSLCMSWRPTVKLARACNPGVL